MNFYSTCANRAQSTFVLIVGYSWLNGHEVIIGNVGIGWAVAWRRWVLVVIGRTFVRNDWTYSHCAIQAVLLPSF